MRIQWSETSINDLLQIKEYISIGSPHYANIFINRIFAITKKSSTFPQIGRKVPEMNRDDIREVIFRNYRIIYHLEDSLITVLTVIHGARNLQSDTINID